jgi:hypothetical protein
MLRYLDLPDFYPHCAVEYRFPCAGIPRPVLCISHIVRAQKGTQGIVRKSPSLFKIVSPLCPLLVSIVDEHRGVEVQVVSSNAMPLYNGNRQSADCLTQSL